MKTTFAIRAGSIALVLAASAFGQAKPAEYHSASELKEHFIKLAEEAKTKKSGSTGADLGAYENHALKLSYRRETGLAEVHVHLADVMFVTGGSATMVTGGSLVEPKNENVNEIRGKSIDGGTRQVLSAGDVIHIPAGTPHQLLLDQGKDFQAFVVKIHD
jgi:mannose-6-phosphate isomerase-like protein (cupin superfamily)